MDVRFEVETMASLSDNGELREEGAPGESRPESILDSLLLLFKMGHSTRPIVHGVCPVSPPLLSTLNTMR